MLFRDILLNMKMCEVCNRKQCKIHMYLIVNSIKSIKGFEVMGEKINCTEEVLPH